MAIRVLLADDHEVVRYGMSFVLDGVTDIDAVGEAASGPEALALCGQLHPDLVLLDFAMPGLSGGRPDRGVAKELPAGAHTGAVDVQG